jgi:7-cyano-7-deazaguanine synthase
MNEALMLHSGGLDSFVTSALLLGSGKKITALCFDYGQSTADVEWKAAQACVQEMKDAYGPDSITLHQEKLLDYLKWVKDYAIVGGTALDHSQDGKLFFVPGRNIVFLLFTAIAGYQMGIKEVVFSSHRSDMVSGDCRPEFVSALQDAFRWGFGIRGAQEPYRIWSPLQDMTKAEAVSEGTRRGLRLELSWSCYRSGELHCGVCHNCVDRKKAFIEAGVVDHTGYEVSDEKV